MKNVCYVLSRRFHFFFSTLQQVLHCVLKRRTEFSTPLHSLSHPFIFTLYFCFANAILSNYIKNVYCRFMALCIVPSCSLDPNFTAELFTVLSFFAPLPLCSYSCIFFPRLLLTCEVIAIALVLNPLFRTILFF